MNRGWGAIWLLFTGLAQAQGGNPWQAVQHAQSRVELARERLQLAQERADARHARQDLAQATAHLLTALEAVRQAEAALAGDAPLRPAQGAAAASAAAQAQARPQVEDCPCEADRTCVGPRGGRYCFTASGRKRYQ